MNVEHARGFTLIELAIVVVIATLVLAIGVPGFGSYKRSLLKWQVREQLIQDLRDARQAAITQHGRVVVVFGNGVTTTDVTTYSIHTDRNGDGVIQSTEPRSVKKLPKGARLSAVELSPTDSLTFDTSGILRSGSGGGRLVFTTIPGVTDTLMVSVAGMAYRP